MHLITFALPKTISMTFSLRPLLFLLLLGLLACNGKQDRSSADQADLPFSVTLLTWRYLAQDAEIIKGFETRLNTRVKVVVWPMRDIIAAAQAGKQLPADIVLVPTIEDAMRLEGFGSLQPFFVDAFTNGDVADRYLDNEGYYAGLTRWTMVSVYNPNSVTPTEAGTYRGIIEAPLRGIRVGLAHPDSSGIAGVISGLHTNLNPDAAALWAQGIYQQASGGMQGSDYDQLERMLRGELDMAVVSLGAAVRWFLNGNPQHFKAAEIWRVRFPHTEATDMNFYNMTCITMAKNATNREMAIQLINYLFAKDVQEKISSAWFEFPTHTFAEGEDYLYAFPDRLGLKVSAETIEQNLPIAWALINAQAGQ